MKLKPVLMAAAIMMLTSCGLFAQNTKNSKTLVMYFSWVITKKESNERNKSFAGCLVVQDSESGIELSGNAAKGKVLPHKLASFEIAHTMPRMLIEKETAEFTASVIEEVRKGLD